MEKQIIEWFAELPDGYRELAIKNCTNPDRVVDKMNYAIDYGITSWKDTPEGFYFWESVSDHFIDPSYPIPPLPVAQGEPEPDQILTELKAIREEIAEIRKLLEAKP